jgi:hypothetical protein
MGMTSITSKRRAGTNQASPTLNIDYSRSPPEVFQDAARLMMHMDGDCSLLYLDGTFGGTVDNEELPSWCPNWSKPFVTDMYKITTSTEPSLGRKGFYFENRCLYIKEFLFGLVLSVLSEVADYEIGRKMYS